MTKDHKRIHKFITKYIATHGYPPGMLTIGTALKLSKGSVRQMLNIMVKNGYLERRKQPQIGAYRPVDKPFAL